MPPIDQAVSSRSLYSCTTQFSTAGIYSSLPFPRILVHEYLSTAAITADNNHCGRTYLCKTHGRSPDSLVLQEAESELRKMFVRTLCGHGDLHFCRSKVFVDHHVFVVSRII
jgi:hypothetical protein